MPGFDSRGGASLQRGFPYRPGEGRDPVGGRCLGAVTGPRPSPGWSGKGEAISAVPPAPRHFASNNAASCSMIVPPSCSASMIVTARS